MNPAKTSTLALAVFALSASGLLLGGEAAHAGSTVAIRYAAVNGAGMTCTSAAPCDLPTAINSASNAGEVIIEPGNYGSSGDPLAVTLYDHTLALDIHGAPGAKPPVIYTSANPGFGIGASTLSDVRITSVGAFAFDAFPHGKVDHVTAQNLTPDGTACGAGKSLTDSLCIASGSGGIAVGVNGTTGPTSTSVSIQGVTAEAIGPTGGRGLLADAGVGVAVNVTATNDIFHGTESDVIAETDDSTATSTVALDHSDFATQGTQGNNGTHSVTSGAADIDTPPVFKNVNKNNFAEALTSPTINAGIVIAKSSSDTDLAGAPRVLGASTDMGAYEFLQKPVVKKLKVASIVKHTAHLSVPVNAEGLATKLTVTVGVGAKHSSVMHSAGKGRSLATAKFKVTGLTPHHKYTISVTAKNSAGKAVSNKVHVTVH